MSRRNPTAGKRRYDRHDPDTAPMTTWVEREWKGELKEEARQASEYLPDWSLSKHLRFIIDDYRGKWDKKYRPIQYALSAKKRG